MNNHPLINEPHAQVHASASHSHLWSLTDGTGLHAPFGELTYDDSGRVCCHLCGRWWVSLASHVRAHGHNADTYRATMGLLLTQELVATALSRQISTRQRTLYDQDEDVRGQLKPGQEMASSGQLAWRRKQADAARDPSPARDRVAHKTLAQGRKTQQARRADALAARLEELGALDLSTYLRDAYSAGESLAKLAAATGLGRSQLLAALEVAEVVRRPSGVNTPEGKRSRAERADRQAAEQLGVDDLAAWLVARRREGWTLQRLADAVGHSAPWVRARLA